MSDLNIKYSRDTKLIHHAREPQRHFGAVNTPPYRASTIIFDDYDAFKKADFAEKKPWHDGGLTYGRRGTPITHELSAAISAIEGADDCVLTGSGVAAIHIVMSTFLSSGDHVLIMDGVYTPTKSWVENFGHKMGIAYDFFPANISPTDFADLIKDNTTLIMLEAPASLSFEIPDLPALSTIAKQKGIITALDNTWSAGYFLNAFDMGCDISIQAGTKYYMGHSDGCFGSVASRGNIGRKLFEMIHVMGQSLDADTAFLALRGLRTLSVRMKQHEKSALEIAKYLSDHPKVKKIFHPALEDSPDHAIWKRDFTGSSGLFSIILNDNSEEAVKKFIDSLRLFAIGFSWGGFESLVIPCFADNLVRDFDGNIQKGDIPIRIHIGLEDVKDLKADLQNALDLLY